MAEPTTYVFDFDSTLVRIETLEVLADIALAGAPDAAAIRAEVAALTDQAMAGDLPFGEALRRRADAPARLVRRIGGGDEEDLVEAQLLARFFGAAQVRQVDGIEGAAEHPDAPRRAAAGAAHERICPLPWMTYL